MLWKMAHCFLDGLGTIASIAFLATYPQIAGADDIPRCMPLTVPVAFVAEAPDPYREFCASNFGACTLDGPSVIEWSVDLHRLLRETNVGVNRSVKFVPDMENSGQEEVWDFPREGRGTARTLRWRNVGYWLTQGYLVLP